MARIYTGLDVNSDFSGTFPWKSELLADASGAKQAYVDVGPRDAPLTFLCAHGNPTWGYLYRKFIARLSPRYRVIAPDHVGFGRSDKPRDPGYFTLERHIGNLERLMERAGADRVVPVVQDWGGPTGMGWATRHPEKVAGVVVLNTWAFVNEGGMKLPWLFKFLVLGQGGWKRATESNIFVELFLGKGGTKKLSEAEMAPYRAPHPTPAERVGIGRFPQLIAQRGDTAHESYATLAEIEARLPRLREKPALIVWGTRDRAFREPQLQQWSRTFSQVDGPHRLANAAHFLQEDAPEEILAHIERWAPGVISKPAS